MSPQAAIDTIIFDWGGVIQRSYDHSHRHLLDAELDLPLGSVEEAVFGSAIWQEASLGHCSGDDAWYTIVTSLGLAQSRTNEFVRRFFAGDRIDAQIVDAIRRLSEAGYRVALLSNAPPPRSAEGAAAARWGLDGLFDLQVFSYEVGALKPDARMYQAVTSRLRVAATHCLFIDDSPPNVEAARQLGMMALHFADASTLLDYLATQFPDALAEKPS